MSKVEDCRPSDLTMLYGRVKQFNDKYCKDRPGKVSVRVLPAETWYDSDNGLYVAPCYQIVYRGEDVCRSKTPLLASKCLSRDMVRRVLANMDIIDRYSR